MFSKSEMTELLSDFVGIRTVNPPGENYKKMADLIAGICREMGLSTFIIKTSDEYVKNLGLTMPRYNVVARWDVGAKETIHLNSHFDVVPVTAGWKTDPFKAKIIGNKLFGRGASDDKGDIALRLLVLRMLKKQGVAPRFNLELSFTCDEEGGGAAGFGYLVNQGFVKPDFAIGEGKSGVKVSHGNKGLLFLRVSVFGKPAHAAYSNEAGINAFEKMTMLSDALLKLKTKVVAKVSNHEFEKEIFKRPSFVLGGEVSGGGRINTVPDKCVFTIDRRIIPEEKADDALAEIMNCIDDAKKKDGEMKVEVEVLNKMEASFVDVDSKICRLMDEAVKAVHGRKAEFILTAGATDMHYLSELGIPCIGYSAMGANIHSDDEYVLIDSMAETARVLYYLLKGP